MYMPYEYREQGNFDEGFTAYYEKNIIPLAKKYEAKRPYKKAHDYLNIFTAITTGLGTSYAILKSSWFLKFAQKGRKSGNLLILPPMLSWWFFVYSSRRKYFLAVKTEIVPIILNFFGDCKYFPESTLGVRTLDTHTGYYKSFNVFKCEDIISFEHQGLLCQVFERTFWDFKQPTGQIFIYINSETHFGIDAVIFSKGRKNASVIDKRLLKKRNLFHSPAFVNADFDFHRHFRLHTTDTEINRWLTQRFFESLSSLKDAYGQSGLVFSVKDRSVLIQIDSKGNFFEIGQNHNLPVANQKDIRKFLEEVHTTLGLVEALCDTISQQKSEKK